MWPNPHPVMAYRNSGVGVPAPEIHLSAIFCVQMSTTVGRVGLRKEVESDSSACQPDASGHQLPGISLWSFCSIMESTHAEIFPELYT